MTWKKNTKRYVTLTKFGKLRGSSYRYFFFLFFRVEVQNPTIKQQPPVYDLEKIPLQKQD